MNFAQWNDNKGLLTMVHDDTRQTLIARALDRSDEETWEEFTGIYTAFIRGVLFKLGVDADDMDDLTQEIVITLWKKLEFYVPSKGSFRAWLTSVVRNCSNSYLRKKITYNERKISLQSHDSLSDPEIDTLITKEWQTFISKQAMIQLRSVFEENTIQCFLENLEGITAETTAKNLNISVETVYSARKRVKARLLREIKHLRAHLEF